jgi:hypothetical protein
MTLASKNSLQHRPAANLHEGSAELRDGVKPATRSQIWPPSKREAIFALEQKKCRFNEPCFGTAGSATVR